MLLQHVKIQFLFGLASVESVLQKDRKQREDATLYGYCSTCSVGGYRIVVLQVGPPFSRQAKKETVKYLVLDNISL